MAVRKVSNSKTGHQVHLKTLLLVPFNKPATYHFLLVFHCNYVFILYLFRHTISYSQVKTSRDPDNIPFGRAAVMGSTLIINI